MLLMMQVLFCGSPGSTHLFFLSPFCLCPECSAGWMLAVAELLSQCPGWAAALVVERASENVERAAPVHMSAKFPVETPGWSC